MEQSFLFDLTPAVDALHKALHDADDALESAEIDADLSTFRKLLERLEYWRQGVDENADGIDLQSFDTIASDLQEAIDDHASAQQCASEAVGKDSGLVSDALEWVDELQTRFADAEFDALWAEVDHARAMVRAPYVPRLDCPACHRFQTGGSGYGTVPHDPECPNRPEWRPKCGPCARGVEVDVRQHAPSCPVRAAEPPRRVFVDLDPSTGLPPRPQSKAAVMADLDRLTAGRPAHVACTRCRTGRGERHGRGCPNVARRSA